MTQTQPAGWYNDPTSVGTFRYWDGRLWTNQISSGGSTATDPNPLDPAVAGSPPAPGTSAPMPPAAPAAAPVVVTQKSSAFGTILGILVAVILVAILIIVLANQGDDDGSTPTTETPVTTEAPSS
jgi:hypothetical protein